MKHVVQFSGGLCSFWAAHRVIRRWGAIDEIVLLFADTCMEDEDLYRFNHDAEAYLGVSITRIADGRTPWQVFHDEGIIGCSRLDLCSRILKRDLLDRWRLENTTPEDSKFYVGLDWTEEHRLIGRGDGKGIRACFLPWAVEAPMMDEPLWDKCKMRRECEALGIKVPRLYDLGFPHNNCGGFCIKAGHAHFAHLLKTMPERYRWHEEQEEKMRAQIGDYSVMKDRRHGTTKSLTLRYLREMIELGVRDYDTEDWGGCGCSVES